MKYIVNFILWLIVLTTVTIKQVIRFGLLTVWYLKFPKLKKYKLQNSTHAVNPFIPYTGKTKYDSIFHYMLRFK